MTSDWNLKYKFWSKICNIFSLIVLIFLALGTGIHALPDILNQNGSSIYLYASASTLHAIYILIDITILLSILIALPAAIRADYVKRNGLLEDLRLSRSRE